ILMPNFLVERQRVGIGWGFGDDAAVERYIDGWVDRVAGRERPDLASTPVDRDRVRLQREVFRAGVELRPDRSDENRVPQDREVVAGEVAVIRGRDQVDHVLKEQVVLELTLARLPLDVHGDL